jgi:hypothetical protein
MTSMRRVIGFDRIVRRDWLDAAASLVVAGESAAEGRQKLWSMLEGVVSGSTNNSARGKTLTVLSRIWLVVRSEARPIRDAAASLFADSAPDGRLCLHWTMSLAAYPFFGEVVATAGRLLAVNDELLLSQLRRRAIESWGDRSTLKPAVLRILRSLVHWGVLRDGERPGVYLPALKRALATGTHAELLLEGLLLSIGSGLPLRQAVAHPALFPFAIQLDSTQLRRSQRLRIHRQGDQADFVETT